MSRQEDIKKLTIKYNRRLQALRERKALYGLDTPIAILTEIEDIELEIENLSIELEELENAKEQTKQMDVSSSGNIQKTIGGSNMDPATIAVTVVAILTPYLAKAGETAAEKAGEAAWEKAKEIYQTIKTRFENESDEYPRQTMKRFEEKPETRQGTMQEALEEILDQDPDFAKALADLLKEADQAGTGAVFNVNISGGEVGEVININKLEGGLTINKKED